MSRAAVTLAVNPVEPENSSSRVQVVVSGSVAIESNFKWFAKFGVSLWRRQKQKV